MSMVARILLLVLVLWLLVGGFGWHSYGWHPVFVGGPGALIIVLVVLIVLGVV